MVVFLTSSPTGPLDGSRKVVGLDKKNRFVDNLRKYWKKDAKNLMITATPDAYEQNDEMISFFEWFDNSNIKYNFDGFRVDHIDHIVDEVSQNKKGQLNGCRLKTA